LGILTNIVAAEEDELAAIGESLHPADEWRGIERRGLDAAKIAMLHCLLSGDQFEQVIDAYEPVYVADEGALVLRIAEEATEKLAFLDEYALERVAEELAATEEFEMAGWETEDALDLVTELADLARYAKPQGLTLFAWMHPLLT
jgi:hypothetical protein